MPKDTIHRIIHQEMTHIPVPSSAICAKVYRKLLEYDKQGLLNADATAEERLTFLIDSFDKYDCPQTVSALKKERAVIAKFYRGTK